jgi:hypothetical protein
MAQDYNELSPEEPALYRPRLEALTVDLKRGGP